MSSFEYDEYQRFLRYKFGSHSFFIVGGLWVLNLFLKMYHIEWAQSLEMEITFILMLAVLYSVVRSTYHGAYYGKTDKPGLFNILFVIIALLNFPSYFTLKNDLIVNGRLTNDSFPLFMGMFWLAIPVTYFIRMIVDKKRAENDV